MGLFIDIYVEYLIRVIIRLVRRWNAKSWTVVTAEITAASYRAGGIGCAVADIGYRYEIDDQVHIGTNSVPFIFSSSAREYVEHCSPNSQIVIRVKLGSPALSVVREDDLYRLEQGFRLQTK